MALFVAKRDDWIEASGSARGDVVRHQRDNCKNRGDGEECRQVGGGNTEEQILHHGSARAKR